MKPKIFSSFENVVHSVHMSMPDEYPIGMAAVLAQDMIQKGEAIIQRQKIRETRKDSFHRGKRSYCMQINKAEEKIKALEKVIWDLRAYIGHAKGCRFGVEGIWGDPDTDFCTCNFEEMVEEVRKVLAIKI